MGSPTKKPATNTDQQQIHELEYTPDNVTDTLPILDENPLPPKSLKRAKEKPVKKNMVPYENRAVYVSGLPTDTNEEEVVEYFEKVGSIGLDYKGDKNVKLYSYPDSDILKGDARITFHKAASVQLAITLLHDSPFRYNHKNISVTEAVFDKDKKPEETEGQSKKIKLTPAQKLKIQEKKNKLEKKLDWYEEQTAPSPKWLKVVVLKHMFKPEQFLTDPGFLLELKEDIREEAEAWGEVTNIVVFDKHPEGVCSVKYKDEISALACVKKFNGRFYEGRQIIATIYDGVTKYDQAKVNETAEEEKDRLHKYAMYLEGDDEEKANNTDAATSSDSE